jgi:hypothetical protein
MTLVLTLLFTLNLILRIHPRRSAAKDVLSD